jgi:hypothetical protein
MSKVEMDKIISLKFYNSPRSLNCTRCDPVIWKVGHFHKRFCLTCSVSSIEMCPVNTTPLRPVTTNRFPCHGLSVGKFDWLKRARVRPNFGKKNCHSQQIDIIYIHPSWPCKFCRHRLLVSLCLCHEPCCITTHTVDIFSLEFDSAKKRKQLSTLMSVNCFISKYCFQFCKGVEKA